MLSLLRRLLKNEQRPTIIESAAITLLIASAAFQVMFMVGPKAI